MISTGTYFLRFRGFRFFWPVRRQNSSGTYYYSVKSEKSVQISIVFDVRQFWLERRHWNMLSYTQTSFFIFCIIGGGGGAGFFFRNVEFTETEDRAKFRSNESPDNLRLEDKCKLWHEAAGDTSFEDCCSCSPMIDLRGVGWGDMLTTDFRIVLWANYQN